MRRYLTSLLLFVVVLPLYASEGETKIVREFKLGEVDKYHGKFEINFEGIVVETTIDFTETVRKVYDDGQADVLINATSVKVNMGGKIDVVSSLPHLLQRYSKLGVPLGNPSGSLGQGRLLLYTQLLGPVIDKALTVGKDISFTWSNPSQPGSRIDAKVNLQSVVKGIANLVGSYSSWSGKTANKPTRIELKLQMDLNRKKPMKIEGKSQGPSQRTDVTDDEVVKFTVERVS